MTHYNHFAVFENETAAYGQAQVCRTAEPWGSACWFFWAHEYEQGHWKQQINRTIVLWDVSQAVLIRSERLRDHCLAEEAVQETFRIACAKADRLAESENRQGWLINTLKNVLHLRTWGRRFWASETDRYWKQDHAWSLKRARHMFLRHNMTARNKAGLKIAVIK